MKASRKNRPQAVRHRPVAFDDSRDSIRLWSDTAGESQFFDSTEHASVPRGGVRRLLSLDASGDPERIFWSGVWGPPGGPHASPRSAVRSAVAWRPLVKVPRRIRSLQAQQRRADWRAFQLLQVQAPARVRFCVARKMRKQVLFALGVAGRRGSAPGRGGRYWRSENSNWRC